MLNKKVLDVLNSQINFEFFSSNIYLQMSSWCDYNGYPGCSAFFRRQAQEELVHMNKFFDYIAEKDECPLVGAIDAPATEYKSLLEVFEKSLEHEKEVTSRINNIAAVSFEDKDFSTFNFVQFFITEQIEEEANFRKILDKFRLAGEDKRGLFFLDREVEQFNTQLLSTAGTATA